MLKIRIHAYIIIVVVQFSYFEYTIGLSHDNKINTTFPDSSRANITEAISDEKRLLIDLINYYQTVTNVGRPVKNSSAVMNISFALGLIRMDVEEKDNMLIVSAWQKLRWTDEYLQWNPEDYGGITRVTFPTKYIWMPDIMLYNTASTEKFERDVNILVNYQGRIHWYPHRIFYSTCSIDVKNFPFDNQTCNLWFGSWTHKVTEVDLQLGIPNGVDLSTFQSDFKETSKWDVLDLEAERMVDEMAVITIKLYLQRRMIFSSYILTFPVIFISFLILLVFWLPADHADKSNLGMTIFGSLLLLLLILVEAAPPASAAIPLLGIYYCFNIVLVMLSIFLSSLVTHIGSPGTINKPKHPLPVWVKRLFRCPSCSYSVKEVNHVPFTHHQRNRNRSEEEMSNLLEVINKTSSIDCNQAGTNRLSNVLQTYVNQRKSDETLLQKVQVTNADWLHVATILDRVFLFVYFIVITASLVFLFPR